MQNYSNFCSRSWNKEEKLNILLLSKVSSKTTVKTLKHCGLRISWSIRINGLQLLICWHVWSEGSCLPLGSKHDELQDSPKPIKLWNVSLNAQATQEMWSVQNSEVAATPCLYILSPRNRNEPPSYCYSIFPLGLTTQFYMWASTGYCAVLFKWSQQINANHSEWSAIKHQRH